MGYQSSDKAGSSLKTVLIDTVESRNKLPHFYDRVLEEENRTAEESSRLLEAALERFSPKSLADSKKRLSAELPVVEERFSFGK